MAHRLDTVGSGVAFSTQGHKILLPVASIVTAELFVVNFQVHHSAARLTPPAVTAQDLLSLSLVCVKG